MATANDTYAVMPAQAPVQGFLGLDFAASERDRCIDAVADKADRVSPGWSDAAFDILVSFVRQSGGRKFLTEEVRVSSVGRLESPHDNRAWGSVIRRAVKAGLIRQNGFAPARTGHCRPMPLWEGI